MENHPKCPNCGRSLTENEMYCYFCEEDLAEIIGRNKKKHKKTNH